MKCIIILQDPEFVGQLTLPWTEIYQLAATGLKQTNISSIIGLFPSQFVEPHTDFMLYFFHTAVGKQGRLPRRGVVGAQPVACVKKRKKNAPNFSGCQQSVCDDDAACPAIASHSNVSFVLRGLNSLLWSCRSEHQQKLHTPDRGHLGSF